MTSPDSQMMRDSPVTMRLAARLAHRPMTPEESGQLRRRGLGEATEDSFLNA